MTAHTGLYSDQAFLILTAVKSVCQKVNDISAHGIDFVSISRDVDNEIILDADPFLLHGLEACADNVLSWFGDLIEFYVSHNYRMKFWSQPWSRDSKDKFNECWYDRNLEGQAAGEPHIVNMSVRELYFLYDVLKKTSNINRKYDERFIAWMTGIPYDPVTSEIERARREEISHLTDSFKRKILDAEANYQKLKREINRRADRELENAMEEFCHDKTSIQKEYDIKKKAVMEKYKSMMKTSVAA